MKILLLALCSLWLVACSTSSTTVDESLTYRQFAIYSDGDNEITAKGSVSKGQPHGTWFVVDSAGVNNAEVNFQYGTYNGPYMLYYTSYTPEAVGDLKTKGSTTFGSFDGNYIRYNPDSSVLVYYTANGGKVDSIISGSHSDAEQQLSADTKLLKAYREAILEALR